MKSPPSHRWSNRSRQHLEKAVQYWLCFCALLVIGILLTLIGYLSFRGLFIRKSIESMVLPDYEQTFLWPDDTLARERNMSLWLSPAIELGKLRADKLHDIINGEEKNWVHLAESAERLTLFLTPEQLHSLQQSRTQAGLPQKKNRNLKQAGNYISAAAKLLQTPGSMAILPASWGRENWLELTKKHPHLALPRKVSLA
ncbi:MAG: hypothetical protein AAF975_07675, partial [Spirochaetota bacterium]